MNILQSIFLGVVQGASEFLPISSSAHLILAPWLFGFSDPGLAFDVALHFGTLVAIIFFFYKDWMEIFELAFSNFKFQIPARLASRLEAGGSNFKSNPNYKLQITNYNQKILYFLILATIPGVLAGYFLESYAEKAFRSPLLIAFTLAVVGLILYLVDKYHSHRKNLEKITWLDSLFVGLSQAVAIVPGVSRSGATITTGLALGLNRESAARFSFLLSTPIIFGAAVKEFPAFINSDPSLPAILAVASSALSGYLAIKYLLKFVERASYAVFFWYRLALAGLIIIAYFSK